MAIARRGHAAGCAHGPGCPHDIGPAAAGIDGLSAMGRLSALRVPGIDVAEVAQGYGPIERRPATAADLARLTPVDAPPVRPGPAMHRMRPATGAGSGRNYRSVMGAAAPATPIEEDPVTPVTSAPPAIPCGNCLHEPVCLRRRHLDPDASRPAESVAEPEPGLRIRTVTTVECDQYLSLVDLRETTVDRMRALAVVGAQAPAEERTPASFGTVRIASIDELNERVAKAPRVRPALTQESRRNGSDASSALYAARRAEKDALAIAQLREHGGNAEAVGRAMGVSGAAVKGWIARMTAAGSLPDDVAELVAKRTHKAVAS